MLYNTESLLYKPPRTGFSPHKLFLMRRFLRRLRWWGPRPPPRPSQKDAANCRILTALKGIQSN